MELGIQNKITYFIRSKLINNQMTIHSIFIHLKYGYNFKHTILLKKSWDCSATFMLKMQNAFVVTWNRTKQNYWECFKVIFIIIV